MSKRSKRWISLILMLAILVPFFNIAGGPETVSAVTSADIKEELEELERESEELQAEIDALQAQLDESIGELENLVANKDLLDQEIVKLYEQVELVNQQIDVCSKLIADKQEELDAAEARLVQLQKENKERIRAMEENGELSYWTVLAGANSFVELLDRWEMVNEIAKADKLCLEELELAAQQVAATKDQLAEDQVVLQQKREYLDEVQVTLEERRAQTDALLIEIKAQTDLYQEMINESEAMQEELMQSIEFKEEEYEELKKKEEAASRPNTPVIGGVPNVVDGVTWILPCTYNRLSSPFGYRYHPLSGAWKMHNGVDLTGREGTPIVATRSGYVNTAAYQAGGAGYYVSINHGDGFGSIYMHMTHYVVKYGQYVEAGQVIGYMGTTGGSTGVHLHFGISYNGVYVNPVDYVKIV